MEITRASVAFGNQSAGVKATNEFPDKNAADLSIADRFDAASTDRSATCKLSNFQSSLGSSFEQALQNVGKNLNGAAFVGEGLGYKMEEVVTGQTSLLGKSFALGVLHPEHNLDAEPVPSLERPLVVVPGWTGKTTDYAPLVNHLTQNGANGGQTIYVKQGDFFTLAPDGQLKSLPAPPIADKVFEMVFSDIHQGPQSNLPEMRENMDAITQATGSPKIDAVAHSMGGIDTRLYLDQGGDKIDKLMMVATPNHGTPFGNLALAVVNDGISWAEKLGGLSDDDRQSLESLQTEDKSTLLQHLDETWKNQLGRVQAVETDANQALPTPSARPFGEGGDGLVPVSSVAMAGATNLVHAEAVSHKDLTSSKLVYNDMMQFFGWTVHP